MDIEYMRKDFEARFPVPEGVVFDLVANNYCADFWTGVDLKDFYTHQARWESWQAAKEQAAPEGEWGAYTSDVLQDSAYIAGAKFGWNCAIANDEARYQAAIAQRIADRMELRAAAPEVIEPTSDQPNR